MQEHCHRFDNATKKYLIFFYLYYSIRFYLNEIAQQAHLATWTPLWLPPVVQEPSPNHAAVVAASIIVERGAATPRSSLPARHLG
jgi:hypothetical protein